MKFDVIVIGGGHAGCEAALAAARLGAQTLLLTLTNDHIAQMSCNPAIGGVGKGQLVREIDALGGEMAQNADATTIQFRMLNDSRGAAALSPRAQCDRDLYQKRMKLVLERQPNLMIQQAEATGLVTDQDRVTAVTTAFGDRWECRTAVICTGTFLAGKLHYGMQSFPGGRAGDAAANAFARTIREDLKLETARLKTGTPVRVLGKTIDFDSLDFQAPDTTGKVFSFRPLPPDLPLFGSLRLDQRPCYLTYSTEETARVARDNLDQAPMYAGRIHATGARYCPSFEDKVVRFPDRLRHHIYLEPEGVITDEYYLNGISTSLPPAIQWKLIRTLPGLAAAHISRYAYAIEYDFVFPHQIDASLAVRRWPNLFLAGQINGTSGYEEAAAQGLIAGVNAARQVAGLTPPVTIGRDQAYVGVMIDDLVTKDIVEPYRLFTSRAEYRLSLRQDNADRRLTRLGHAIGLVPSSEVSRLDQLERDIDNAIRQLQSIRLEGRSAWALLHHPDFVYERHANLPTFPPRVMEQVVIAARYGGYIEHQERQAQAMRSLDACKIPPDFDFKLPGLSVEAIAKLSKRQPATLGQASRIDGVTPAELALLQVRLKAAQGNRRHSSDELPPIFPDPLS
ncbi:MAG TPA: tRNA uridine-5-carboxymethylaminomethyl(34) synthesis enzyme MnmG [Lentisphaeria bacterium]|nr:tRNA uridine-5-carboxymethylaminomethyl(34) synthesis enzyme MnmG [Lentisphaerota bacterium]OQC16282.1 MAG: tRNA uridine 5-carboxymethylaminomethyl modification enzyme MnmG [Lentisphaerae bacterium ADurb.Bin082]HQC51703.1 tRNA uridine-5-carboxymethylaminomethyl(34) synthesis enzyme MnmG [Lentisphaeria bacterium]HQL87681.1 tRNA uridine-5-carboxymethylaminomethyl(34) synthesis enzyme MnmG [Lentisphaeria bacterium]